jgi:hypothetical protein
MENGRIRVAGTRFEAAGLGGHRAGPGASYTTEDGVAEPEDAGSQDGRIGQAASAQVDGDVNLTHCG